MRIEVEPRDATRGLPHLAGTAHDDLEEAERVPALPEGAGEVRCFLCCHFFPALG
jgi:hypothetical protein